MNLPDGRITAEGMQKSLAENQAKLAERSGFGFEPQNDIQRRVAEQRSANEQNINESAGEIDKNRSTVQASSDILKGEDLNAQSKFQINHKQAQIEQLKPVLDSEQKRIFEQQLAELRKKSG